MSIRELNDLYVVVRDGAKDMPPPGTVFSGAFGETLDEAAGFVPHGTIRFTTIGAILAHGGSVTIKPELTRSGLLNDRHVDVCEGSARSVSSDLVPNPVPKNKRIG